MHHKVLSLNYCGFIPNDDSNTCTWVFWMLHAFASQANALPFSLHSKMATSSQLGSFAVCETCETVNWDALRWHTNGLVYVSSTQQGARTNLFAADAGADVHAADGQFSRLVATNLFAADAAADAHAADGQYMYNLRSSARICCNPLDLELKSSWIQRESCVYLHPVTGLFTRTDTRDLASSSWILRLQQGHQCRSASDDTIWLLQMSNCRANRSSASTLAVP